jgi:uncharacterized paraquat-inducible protein A
MMSGCEGRIAGDAMGVDTSSVFKRALHCSRCDEAFYFTLRAIAENQKLACQHCGTDMDLTDEAYWPLVADVRATIRAISDPR